jgi:hypothetical protein
VDYICRSEFSNKCSSRRVQPMDSAILRIDSHPIDIIISIVIILLNIRNIK